MYEDIIDKFGQKLMNSGYSREQVKKITIAGIKGWGRRVKRCKEEGRKVWRSSRDSLESRMKTKLIGKSSWFKKRKSTREQHSKLGGKMRSNPGAKKKPERTSTPRTVIFVEQTPGGELALKMREMFTRVEPMIGFSVKVVERTGRSLASMFPLTNLWEGTQCGRDSECRTCYQGAELLPNCTKQSVMYENVCATCIPGAGSKRPLEERDIPTDKAAIYVGETSRSILERTREHWKGYMGAKKDNHMWKHQEMEHKGEPAKFIMRVEGSNKSALSRQVSEAVRIRRRGGEGNILNSKSEYNRSHIPRLQVEDEEKTKKREEYLRKMGEEIERSMDGAQNLGAR